jgi:phosphohistidine swiveling domain-containing protein
MNKLSLQEWRARPRSAIAAFPSMYTMAYLTGEIGLKEYGAKLTAIYTIFTETDLECVMQSKEDYEKIGSELMIKFKKDQTFLDGLIEWSEPRVNLLYDFLDENLSRDKIVNLTNKEIAEKYLEYVDKYFSFHLKNTPSWWIGASIAERELRDYLIKNDIESVASIITDSSEYGSENFYEEISLLDIAIRLKEIKSDKVNSIDELPDEIRLDLKKHCREFFSIPFGYNTGVVWDELYFFNKLKILLDEDPVNLKENKLEEIKNKILKRDSLVKDLNLPSDILNLVFSLRKLTYLQELKKTTQTRSHPLLQMVIKKEIAKRIGVDQKYMDYFSETEIVDSLLSEKSSVSEDELKSRDGFCILVVKDTKYSWLYEEEAREFVKDNELMQDVKGTKEIKGVVASKGFARGKVKVCRTSIEIGKVEEGDVLVTAMTTPDFVPAMRKAVAIITDEGGITCHAAIVSRELGKPCIIGTKIATKALKDGDVVEVDADNGVVRIIK